MARIKVKQLHFSEENYLSYTKKTILHVTITFSLKQGRANKNKQWTHLGALKPPV